TIAPSHLGGFMDTWREIKPLSAEGLSLQMKKVCMVQNPSCDYLINNFLECKHICEEVAYFLLDSIKKKLLDFVKTQGLDVEGHYPLYKLLESWNR
ncbi:MAG: hypothetical protein JW891_04550, partial [Candidatus Lokiarchaeota archaeon]|nr:hypothetical protein [Candidatus Lokiarchaeota archaeon]